MLVRSVEWNYRMFLLEEVVYGWILYIGSFFIRVFFKF